MNRLTGVRKKSILGNVLLPGPFDNDNIEFDKSDVESLLEANINPHLIENQLINRDDKGMKVDEQ